MNKAKFLQLHRKIFFFKFEILVAVAIPVVWLTLLFLSGKGPSMFATGSWLKMSAGDDSWMPLTRALGQIEAGKAIYWPLFFQEHIKFQYPPSSILIFKWLKDIGIGNSAMLNQLNWWLVGGNAALVGALGLAMAKDSKNEEIRKNQGLVGLLCFLACLLSYPVMRSYALGQAQVWINFLFALACVGWYSGYKLVAGAAIGLICLIKPQFCLFLAWGMIAGQRRFVFGWMAIFVPVTIFSLLFFGIGEHLQYFHVLSSLAKTGESFFANQSINGLLNRLLENGPILEWEAKSFPPINPFVRWLTLVSSALIVGTVLIRQLKRPADLGDFQLAALAFTMASPIAWEHHYGIMPAMFVCAYFNLPEGILAQRRAAVLLALSFLLSQVSLVKWGAASESPWNLIYSHSVIGAGLLFYMMFYSKRHATRPKVIVDAMNFHPDVTEQLCIERAKT